MSRLNKIVYLIMTFIFFIAFDLYLSNYILNSLRFNFNANPIFELIFVQNTGAAFSILEDSQLFLIIFSTLMIITLLLFIVKNIIRLSTFVLFWTAMLLAGIICNLYERIIFGYVRDFIKLNFINFPVFNISDVFINISVFVLIFLIIKNRAKM